MAAPTRTPLMAGNWKMNLNHQEAVVLVQKLAWTLSDKKHDYGKVEAVVPESWDCPRSGLPASMDAENPPAPPKTEPYKTHLAYVKERRSDAEAKDILEEALSTLRQRRKSGDLIF